MHIYVCQCYFYTTKLTWVKFYQLLKDMWHFNWAALFSVTFTQPFNKSWCWCCYWYFSFCLTSLFLWLPPYYPSKELLEQDFYWLTGSDCLSCHLLNPPSLTAVAVNINTWSHLRLTYIQTLITAIISTCYSVDWKYLVPYTEKIVSADRRWHGLYISAA